MPKRQRSLSPARISSQSVKDGLEISIVDFTTGVGLPQVHISKTGLTDLVKSHRYVIFAETEQKFGIDVTTDATFDWGEANALEVSIAFDLGNTVNQKRVYLVRPVAGAKPSALDTDEALCEMWPRKECLTYCIDHILIQDPTSVEGVTSAFYFLFTHVTNGCALRRRPRNRRSSEKVSEHQGKIRVEVQKIIVKAGSQRYPGLDDVVTSDVRSSTQDLLTNGLELEITIAKVEKAGLLSYGSAFRPTACKPTSTPSNFVFEFLYRSKKMFPVIVDPEFQHEIAGHASLRWIAMVAHRRPQLTISPSEPMPSVTDQEISGVPESPLYNDPLSHTNPAIAMTPSSLTRSDIRERETHGGSIAPSISPIRSPSDTINSSHSWHQMRQAFETFEDERRKREEDNQHDLLDLRNKLEQLYNEESEVEAEIAKRRLRLATYEAEHHEKIKARKEEIELQISQLEERHIAREKEFEMAIETFVSTVKKVN